jgi:tetratricopeptide (TPR) repeat protein
MKCLLLLLLVSQVFASTCQNELLRLRDQGFSESLIEKSRECLKQNPRSASLHRLRGLILMEANQPLAAASAFRRTQELDPDLEDAWIYELVAYLHAQDPLKRHRQSIQRIKKQFSNRPEILAEAGNILIQAKEMSTAFEYFKSLLDENYPEPWIYHFKLGQMYYLVKTWDDALQQFVLAQRLNPKSPLVYHWLGKVWEARGNTEYAQAFYKDALNMGYTEPDESHKRPR